MQFVIQTGGEGTRLQKISKGKPKSLFKILNKSIIDYQIEAIKKFKSNKIIILNNWKFKNLEKHLKVKYGNIFKFFNEKKPLGTGGSLKNLEEIQNKEFVMLFGDLIFNFDFKKLQDYHSKKKSDLTLVAHPNTHPHDSDLVETDKFDRMINFYKKPHSRKNLGNLSE